MGSMEALLGDNLENVGGSLAAMINADGLLKTFFGSAEGLVVGGGDK